MRTYLVGGAVRDMVAGRSAKDFDYVVVGSTVEAMLANGFRQVGADFPVFLDSMGRQFALARRERKSGPGHRGFSVEFDPSVSLKEDLSRRDLTMNAMAYPVDDEGYAESNFDPNKLIDPYGGRDDLLIGRLRHISDDAFPEDPLRVLRVARFAAQLSGFYVHEPTTLLMRHMVASGAISELTAERVFAEIDRALGSPRPSRFFRVLEDIGALAVVLPEVAALIDAPENQEYHPEGTTFEHVMLVLDAAAATAPGDSHVGWAALCHDLGKAATPQERLPLHPGHEEVSGRLATSLLERLKAPRYLTDMTVACCLQHMRVKRWEEMRPGKILRMLEALGALRNPERLSVFLSLCVADERGRLRPADEPWLAKLRQFLAAAFSAVIAIRGLDVLADPAHADKKPGPWVGEVLIQRRVKAIRNVKAAYVGKDV